MRSPSRARLVKCAGCGKGFETRHSQGKYCSDSCARDGERASWRKYGIRNRAVRRAYHRALYRRNPRAVLERTAAYHRTPAGRAAQRVNGERQRAKFPEKMLARRAVALALQAGKLRRCPCRCGAIKVQAHHPDYSRPLEVIWLCSLCHAIEEGRSILTDGKVGIVIEDGSVVAVDGEPVAAEAGAS